MPNSSRPPASSAYPALSHGTPQIPPFPQLLHIKNESHSTPEPLSIMPDSHDHLMMSPDEDDDGHDSRGGSPPPLEKKRKTTNTRRRVVQSCSECRRRKIRCDKKFPCGPCILRNEQSRCHEVGLADKTPTLPPNGGNWASSADIGHVNHRLDALEASLLKSGALRREDLDYFLKTISETEALTGRKKAKIEDLIDDTEGAALTLEHLAFGRSRADGSHAIPHFATRLSSVSKPAPNNDYHLAKSNIVYPSPTNGYDPASGSSTHKSGMQPFNTPDSGRKELSAEERKQKLDKIMDIMGPLEVFDMFFKKTDIAMAALSKLLPPRQRGELLVKAYLEKVDWLHRCVHVPTFLRQCNDLHNLPPDKVTQEIALPFLGLYFTVCTLGLQFMSKDEISLHFTEEEAHTLPDTWFHAARSALWASDFFTNHTMENLQTILLLGVFMNNRDRADAAWALLGAAIKMAQGLGLSRLGAEQQIIDGKPLPMWTGRWESVIQREVGRRIWWNLVFLDWSLAPSYNYSCSIQPDQIKTALPANIEDEDIIDGMPLRPQPLSVRTSMSFQLARLRFAEISQRQIWQANNNNHPPYSFVLSVDGELRKAMMELPTFFQPDPTNKAPPPKNPKLSSNITKRSFSTSPSTREQCIRAARASLRMMSDSEGTAAYLEKWWLPLFYVSVSGLVVIIDLLRTSRKDMFTSEFQAKIDEVKGALSQMRKIADVSHPSRAAVKVMALLLDEIEERRKPPGSALGKRRSSPDGDDEESGLQRAVKKLILQAQLEAESPSASMGGLTPQEANVGQVSPATRAVNEQREREGERPVFDAYPMPFVPVPPTINNATDPTPQQPPHPNQFIGVSNASPFTFPVDTTSATTFPAFDTSTTRGYPNNQLDPTVQSMLANYFPPQANTSNTIGSATAPQAPDDFLSRVFGFGWDGVGTTGPPATLGEGLDVLGGPPPRVSGQGQGQGQNGQAGQQGQSRRQPGDLHPPTPHNGQPSQHSSSQQPQGSNGMAPNPYSIGNWTNQGWMA